MKKILFVLMLAASVIFLNACGTTKNPMISDPDGTYLTVKEGNFTYSVKNGRIYEILKGQVGYRMLMDLVDIDLLKNTSKDGVSYWDQIKQSEIEEKLEKDIFPNDPENFNEDDLTEEEKAERENTRKEYLEKLFSDYGLITKEDVHQYYHLLLAREAYAKDQLAKQVAEKDFTENEYKNYFNNNYRNEYHAIVVSFTSERMLLNAFKQLGYAIKKDVGIVKADGTELTKDEVITMFIELYNMVNSYKVEDYPVESLFLNEGVEYTTTDGIKFDLTKIDSLHYTYREIASYESNIQTMLDTMDSYDEGENFYTKKPEVYKSGARYSLFMKISEKNYELENEKANIKEALLKQRLTNPYISNEMTKLRHVNNIELVDQDFIDYYIDEIGQLDLDYKKTKAKAGLVVARTDIKEYTADELFSAMNRNYGISAAVSEIEFSRFVENTSINNIYNFGTKQAVDATRWSVIQQSIKDEKANFENDLYKENGYPSSMGWDKFIKAVYGADNELQLQKYFVFQEVKDRFAKSLGALDGLTEDSDLWKFYLGHMEKAVEEYFNVTGVHLLITVNDSTGNPVNPEEWTEEQVNLAKEFYKQVMDYISDEAYTDSESKKIQNVQNAFNRAPYFVAGLTQDSASQPVIEGASYVFNGIEVSKFKTAGLVALFQDLGQFTNGRMVKEFNDAAKAIWDANSDSDEVVVYGLEKDGEGNYEYLVTDFGYHIYVNTLTTPIETYYADSVIPAFQSAKDFLENSEAAHLSTKLKKALNTYFKPIHTDLISSNNLQIVSYTAIKGLDITINHDDYTVNDFVKFLELTIAAKEASLAYK